MKTSHPDVLSSKLGRKIVIMLLGAGVIPLAVLIASVHLEARTAILDDSQRVLQGYARLAAGQIEKTLELAADRLRVHRAGAATTPFSVIFEVDIEGRPLRHVGRVDGTESFPVTMSRDILERIRPGQVVLLPPSAAGLSAAYALVSRRGNSFLVGVMDSRQAWEVTRATNYSPNDLLLVTDAAGAILASSGDVEPLTRAPAEFFAADRQDGKRTSGFGSFPGMSPVVWARQEVRSPVVKSQGGWSVLMIRKTGVVDDAYRSLYGIVLLYLFPALAILFLLSMRFARRINSPIAELARTAGELARGNWAARAKVTRNDEIGELARTFNFMAEEIGRQYHGRLRLERDALLGRISSSIAHHVNNPLAAIKTRFALLKRTLPPTETASIRGIEEQIDRIATTIQRLMDISDKRIHGDRFVQISHLLGHASSIYAEPFRLKEIQFITSVNTGNYGVIVDGQELREVIASVLDFFLENVPGGQIVRMNAASISDSNLGEFIEIVVSHNCSSLAEAFAKGDEKLVGRIVEIKRDVELCQGSFEAEPVSGGMKFVLKFLSIHSGEAESGAAGSNDGKAVKS